MPDYKFNEGQIEDGHQYHQGAVAKPVPKVRIHCGNDQKNHAVAES